MGRSRETQVGAVVLDWNGGEETLACLASLGASRGVDLRVWLVDNASRSPVLAEAKRRWPAIETIQNESNLGYAGGNNVGIRAALDSGVDHVLVLNNDVRVRPDSVAEMLAAAERCTPVGAVGAKILRLDDPERLWMAWGEVDFRQSLVRLIGEGSRDDDAVRDLRDADWVSGCAILLSRPALEVIGPFDEAYFAYHEEVDWCWRAREQGFRVVYAPEAVVEHRGEGSSGGGTYVSRKQYFAGRNMVRFVRAHGDPSQKLRFAAFLLGTLPFQYVRRLVSGEQAGVVLKVRGALDSLLGRPIPRAELGLD